MLQRKGVGLKAMELAIVIQEISSVYSKLKSRERERERERERGG